MVSNIREYILESHPSAGSKDPIGHSCSNCVYFKEGSCEVNDKVVEAHGKDNLRKWLNYPDRDNGCAFFKSESGVSS